MIVRKYYDDYLGIGVAVYDESNHLLPDSEEQVIKLAREVVRDRQECVDKIKIIHKNMRCDSDNLCSLKAVVEFNGHIYYYYDIYGVVSTERIISLNQALELMYSKLAVFFCY